MSLGNQTNEESSFQIFFRVVIPNIEEMVSSSRFSRWKLWFGWLLNTVFCAILSCHWTLCHYIPFMKSPETKLEIWVKWTSSHRSPSQQPSWFSCFCQRHHFLITQAQRHLFLKICPLLFLSTLAGSFLSHWHHPGTHSQPQMTICIPTHLSATTKARQCLQIYLLTWAGHYASILRGSFYIIQTTLLRD